jgi:NUMOD4 motif/HNH endonuclease
MPHQLELDFSAVKPEEWRGIPGFPGYEVSDWGRVRSVPRSMVDSLRRLRRFPGHILAQHVGSSGYLQCGPWLDGIRVNLMVHRAVLLAFRGTPEKGEEAAHWDGDKQHNALVNLRWTTRMANHHDKRRHGRLGGVLTEEQARAIKSRLDGKYGTLTRLSREYGVKVHVIKHIAYGKTWAWM